MCHPPNLAHRCRSSAKGDILMPERFNATTVEQLKARPADLMRADTLSHRERVAKASSSMQHWGLKLRLSLGRSFQCFLDCDSSHGDAFHACVTFLQRELRYMTKKTHVHVSDLVGLNRLATDVTAGLTDLAEALHNSVASSPGIFGTPMQERSSAMAALVYESVRSVTRLTGGTNDTILAQLAPVLDQSSSPEREAVLAALNGVMGDYLAATGNPLAISMRLRSHGQPLTLEREALAVAVPPPRDKLLLLSTWPVHERSAMEAEGQRFWDRAGP